MRRTWAAGALLITVGWLASPNPVPVYDGVGFPDEPYRYVPTRNTSPATVAEARLPVSGGRNTGGLIANSTEIGPQVSVYAPPQAFAATQTVVLRAEPLPLLPPGPDGVPDSNVYELTLTSGAETVVLRPEAQKPTITMRAATGTEAVLHYRPDRTSPWRALPTRKVGRDGFNADVPGVGDFIVVQAVKPVKEDERDWTLRIALGAAVLLIAGLLLWLRRRGT